MMMSQLLKEILNLDNMVLGYKKVKVNKEESRINSMSV